MRPLRIVRTPIAPAPFLYIGVNNHERHDSDQEDYRRVSEPAKAVTGHGNKQIGFDHFAQDEAQNKRRPRPAKQHHEVADRAENKRDNQVGDLVVGGITADKNQQEYERDDQAAAHVGNFGDLIEDRQAQQHGNDVGDR